MPAWEADDDHWDDNDWDDAEDDEAWSDDEPTIACPYCRREIHEDAQRCPYCERYISAEDSPSPPKPWWIVAGVIVCLALVAYWIVALAN
jgi:hypothetical protein